MSSRKYSTQIVLTALVAVVAALTLGIVVTNAYTHRNDTAALQQTRTNGDLAIKQANHSECRAERQSALTSAQMAIIFGLLGAKDATPDEVAAAGHRGANLPDIDTLVTVGGDLPLIRHGVTLRTLHFTPCPPSIATRKGK